MYLPVALSAGTLLIRFVRLWLDALEQAPGLCTETERLVHHSERDSKYLSIRQLKCLAKADIESSVGSVGYSYGNLLAETIIGLYKTEVFRHCGLWQHIEAVEYVTQEGWAVSIIVGYWG